MLFSDFGEVGEVDISTVFGVAGETCDGRGGGSEDDATIGGIGIAITVTIAGIDDREDRFFDLDLEFGGEGEFGEGAD